MLILGRHCCLYCTITSDALKTAPGARKGLVQLRTLATLKADHDKFVAAGANLKDAKFFNNAICPYYFDVPLDQVHQQLD